jgi:parallel beta-helix repeat protein
MTTTRTTAFALLFLGVIAVQAHSRAARTSAPANGTSIVHVAPPAGDAADRGRIVAALDQARPGDTIQFAPGMYLVGELIAVATPRLTFLGHAQGTTLRGCNPVAYEEMERSVVRAYQEMQTPAGRATGYSKGWDAGTLCGILELTGGDVTIRNLTFEYTKTALILGCCYAELVFRPTRGGYRIEGNTFRSLDSGILLGLSTTEPTVIRGNQFINTFHAVSGGGNHVHVLDNDVSAPEPDRVPSRRHPGFAIAVGALAPAGHESTTAAVTACEHVISGNRISGHPDGILVLSAPGTTCHRNVVRNNTVNVRRVRFTGLGAWASTFRVESDADSTVVGVPLALVGTPVVTGRAGVIEDNLIEGNRVIGAEGIGIEISNSSRNRIVNNEITGVLAREPFPGNTLRPTPQWRDANGAGIWISPGSDENEIAGNPFANIAAHAVVLAGDRNRVETRRATDSVRDLGRSNRVTRSDSSPGSRGDTVQVAAPTGRHEIDRASILAALERVQPGGTIRFAPGTYLMGELITVPLPRLTWLGHPEGTTLRGCEPAAYEQMQREWEAATGNLEARIAAGSRCGGMLLTGGYGTVRDLTFENMQTNLRLGSELEGRTSAGGYRIEGNTFRRSGSGIRSGFLSSDTTIIRGNTFVDMFHAVVVFGGHVQILNNDIATRPGRVRSSYGSPGLALGIRHEHNVIAGNRIDGHPDGIVIMAGAGMSSRYNVIRENTIRVLRASDDQSEVFLAPLALENPGGEGVLEDNRIEGNRIVGGEGIGIELQHASRNRIAHNTITGIAQMRPPPAAVLDRAPGWLQWNGSGIWVSPGSNGNEIVGNTFERIATHAIVLEGDSNRVELLHARDTVHDQGNGNRVGGQDRPDGLLPRPGDDRAHGSDRRYQSRFVQVRGIRLRYMDFGGSGLAVIDTWRRTTPSSTRGGGFLMPTDTTLLVPAAGSDPTRPGT